MKLMQFFELLHLCSFQISGMKSNISFWSFAVQFSILMPFLKFLVLNSEKESHHSSTRAEPELRRTLPPRWRQPQTRIEDSNSGCSWWEKSVRVGRMCPWQHLHPLWATTSQTTQGGSWHIRHAMECHHPKQVSLTLCFFIGWEEEGGGTKILLPSVLVLQILLPMEFSLVLRWPDLL